MEKYDLDFLKERGFFEESYENEDEYEPGKSIEYLFDPQHRVAYYEESDFERENISGIVKNLRKKRNFDLYWFWEEGRVFAFRTFGENKRFIYNLSHSLGTDWEKSKKDKLEKFSSDNPEVLFEVKDVIDHFYSQLWNLRIGIAESIEEDISENEKIMSAQRLIDRLIFIYFLGEKGVIRVIDDAGEELKVKTRKLFKRLLGSSDDFYKTLNKIFFDYLNSKERNDMPLEGETDFSLHIPYLNGGLFREKTLKTKAGTVKESGLEIKGFAWKELIEELNSYNWIIEDFSTKEKEGSLCNLTP